MFEAGDEGFTMAEQFYTLASSSLTACGFSLHVGDMSDIAPKPAKAHLSPLRASAHRTRCHHAGREDRVMAVLRIDGHTRRDPRSPGVRAPPPSRAWLGNARRLRRPD